MNDYELKRKQHSVYLLTYHAVFVVKYRREVITDEMADLMKDEAARLMKGYGGELLEMNADRDHVHLLLSMDPNMAPTKCICSLKTQLSKTVRARYADQYSDRLWGDAFWSSSYFICTTGGASIDTVRKYIEEQGHDRGAGTREKEKSLSSHRQIFKGKKAKFIPDRIILVGVFFRKN